MGTLKPIPGYVKPKYIVKKKTPEQLKASERFKAITQRAQSIRKKHPKIKWKNAIKQASKELY